MRKEHSTPTRPWFDSIITVINKRKGKMGQAAVHFYHCPGDLVVRMREVGVCVQLIEFPTQSPALPLCLLLVSKTGSGLVTFSECNKNARTKIDVNNLIFARKKTSS